MRVRTTVVGCAVVAVTGLLAPAASAAPYTCGGSGDSFDRPDSTDLGPNWTERVANFQIVNGQATQTAPDVGLMTFNGGTDSQACLDVGGGGTGVRYGGFVLNYASNGDNRFIKMQSGGGANYNQYAFYAGNNSLNGTIQSLPTPVASARLHVSQVGGVVTLDIDADKDGDAEQTVSYNYGNAGSTGTGIGVVGYGGALLDNFRFGPPAVPEPPASPADSSPQVPPQSAAKDPTARDTVAPTITNAALSSKVFSVDTKASASASGRGTKLNLTLSEPATVVFVTEQRVGKRWRKIRIFGKRLPAGKSTLDYSGRIKPRGKTRSLRPSRYRIRMRPSDPAGNRGVVSAVGFSVAK